MKETQELIAAWRGLSKGEEAVLATVVETSGSTYRRPGARMLMTREGWQAGLVSGGCLESDLVESAFDRTANGPALVTYDASNDDDALFGFGLGCNGTVRVLLERLPADGGPLAFLEERLSTHTAGVLATVISDGPMLGQRWRVSGEAAAANPKLFSDMEPMLQNGGWQHRQYGDMTVLLESILPPISLLVFGAGPDAIPLTSIAKEMGWRVVLIDRRPTYLSKERFPAADELLLRHASESGSLPFGPRSAAIVMTHSYESDREILNAVLPSDVGFVGVLGPRRRSERLLQELTESGLSVTPEKMERLYAPVGLDIGAEGPHEIALSIVSQVQSFFNGRTGGFLAGRTGALHPSGEAASCMSLA